MGSKWEVFAQFLEVVLHRQEPFSLIINDDQQKPAQKKFFCALRSSSTCARFFNHFSIALFTTFVV